MMKSYIKMSRSKYNSSLKLILSERLALFKEEFSKNLWGELQYLLNVWIYQTEQWSLTSLQLKIAILWPGALTQPLEFLETHFQT